MTFAELMTRPVTEESLEDARIICRLIEARWKQEYLDMPRQLCFVVTVSSQRSSYKPRMIRCFEGEVDAKFALQKSCREIRLQSGVDPTIYTRERGQVWPYPSNGTCEWVFDGESCYWTLSREEVEYDTSVEGCG